MGSKPKAPKQKDSNYMNMQNYRNSPYVRTNVAYAYGVPLGSLKEISGQEALRYGGGIPASCIEVQFTGMPVLRLTDNAVDVIFEGKVYKATPDLKGVTASKSTNKINSQGGRVTLSAVDDVFLDLVQANKTIRARITFAVAMLDRDNDCIAMFIEHRGFIKLPVTTFDPKSGKLEIQFETTNFFEQLDKISGVRPAEAIQQSIWPGDLGLSEALVNETEEWKVKG
ncbi:hypothetical protein [Vibrio fortis]|uniref:hypothetical protein n=1 Tax=Vibrio fortis TaxID=212667 RepID=UPI0038CD9A6B